MGGPADALVRPRSHEELRLLASLLREEGVPLLALGAGFNTLVRDGGVRGVVVQLSLLRGLEVSLPGLLVAEAGVRHASISRLCGERGLSGLEFAVGIPGTLGGWLRMNAGVPGREMRDVVLRVEWMDAKSGEAHGAPAGALAWSYRALELPPGALVLAARLRVEPRDPACVRERMRELLEARRAVQPVDEPSCGSVFKNPTGDHAGRLIEACGLKGARAGGAEISTLHANFIVTRPGARALDVLALIERARAEVRDRFAINLEPEVKIVGAEP